MRTAISILCAAVLAACAVHQSPADHRDLDRLAPGYISSLRHYPEHGVTIAFQINTDTGIIDCDDDVLRIIEERLMQVFIGKKK